MGMMIFQDLMFLIANTFTHNYKADSLEMLYRIKTLHDEISSRFSFLCFMQLACSFRQSLSDLNFARKKKNDISR